MPKESSGFSDRSLDGEREERDFFFFRRRDFGWLWIIGRPPGSPRACMCVLICGISYIS